MHRHECNTHNFYLILENQSKDFSYTIFPIKKINVGKILNLKEIRYLIILSIHILKLEISGCDIRATCPSVFPLRIFRDFLAKTSDGPSARACGST
jgi:hypothetical protein